MKVRRGLKLNLKRDLMGLHPVHNSPTYLFFRCTSFPLRTNAGKKRLSRSFSLLKHDATHHLLPSPSTLTLLLLSTTESRDGRTPASSGLLSTLREHVAMVACSPRADKTAVMYGFWADTFVNRTCAYHQQNIEITDESLSSSDQLVLLYFTKRNIRKPGFHV